MSTRKILESPRDRLKEVLLAAFEAGKAMGALKPPDNKSQGFQDWFKDQPTGYYATTEYMFYRMLLYWQIFRSTTRDDYKARYFEGYTIFKDLYLDAGGNREKTEFNYLNTLLEVDVFEHL